MVKMQSSMSSSSFSREEKKSSSVAIISTSLTAMIGSSILIYPLLYKQYGIITVQIVFTCLALISYKTCTLIILHSSTSEDDFGQVISRHMTSRWFYLYSFVGALNQILMSLVYYMLFVNVAYKQLEFIANHQGIHLLSKDVFTFDEFSFQYFNCLAATGLVLVLMIKDLTLILRMASIAFLGVIIYILFCLSLATQNIQLQNQQGVHIINNINWFSNSFEVVIGSLAQSLLLHNQVGVVFNSAIQPNNNLRDIRLIYLFGYISYSLIGISGYIGILNRIPITKQQNTILDFLSSDNLMVFIMNWFLMIKYAFQIPYFIYVGKLQLFQVFYETKADVPNKYNLMYNLVVVMICFIVGINNHQPVELLAICGGIVAYILSYLFPILIHLTCVYKVSCKDTIIQQIQFNQELETKGLLSNIFNINQQDLHNQIAIPPCESKIYKFRAQNKTFKNIFYYSLLLIGLFNSYLIIKRIYDKKKAHHNLFF